MSSTRIPFLNMELGELKDVVWDKLQEPRSQRKLILVIVSIALLLDNMLYMVIVPIIPDYLRYIGAYTDDVPSGNVSVPPGTPVKHAHHGQDSATGILFASKAIVQLMVNPFSGALIDRIGYDMPMMIGLTIMFFSTAVFACGRSYGLLFFARSLQGVGSAFADTSGLAMIADRFTEENERSKALGIALAFISFGCLVAPPFGGALYQFAGKEMPFLILAFVSLMDGFMLLLVMKPIKTQMKEAQMVKPPSVPIWRLFMDPYIAVCSGALMMSNVALAFLEPTISLWMEDNLTTENWKIGMIWLPAFFPHVFGVILTVKMARKYPQYQWLMAAGGLALEGLCCFIIPFATSYKMLMIPICGICFGIALIDTALLPTLGYLVDVRYVSIYGSIYAIADISYSVAYAIGPIIAGGVVEAIGFTALNFGIAFSNLLYAPVLSYLRHIYDFKPFENEANILMGDPPNKEYQTYSMQDQKQVDGEIRNHLEYKQQETNVDSIEPNGYQQYSNQTGYQQDYQYNQQQQQPQQQQDYQQQYQPQQYQPARALPQQPQGWKESILSLPKKLLAAAPFVNSTSANSEGLQLPKLPVPPLEQTLRKYEKTMLPLLNEKEKQRLRDIIEKFGCPSGLGPKLQLYLEDQQQKLDNWALNYWLKDMYLLNQIALPINSNPGMVFPPKKFTTVLDVARFTARLIEAALDYKSILDNRSLPVEKATSREPGQPLCMAQYYRLLGSCRIPGLPLDSQYIAEIPIKSDHNPEHVVVMCRSQFYCVPIQAADRGRLSEDEICSQLLYILDDAPCLTSSTPVGLLTAWKRPLWAEVRNNLRKDARNCRNLEIIEKSLLVICLDEPLPPNFNSKLQRGAKGHTTFDRDETNLAIQMIHGGGSKHNSANRWFDKTLQIIISGDGACGLCYEHSAAEGIALIQMVEKMLKQVDNLPVNTEVPAVSTSHLPNPERLEWNLEQDEQRKIEDAAGFLDNLVKDLDFAVFRFAGYGKEFIKSCKVSPDAYIQLALQLAYYKLYGKLTATYESASTRRFLKGRVDCIRSASPEALEWARAMALPREDDEMGNKKVTFHLVPDEEKLRLWNEAIKQQTEEMVSNILGQGIDIHLLGLREASRDTCPTAAHPLPELFTDPTYNLANKFLLSTSQVATSADSFMGYGPVEPDGYGASYNPKPDCIIFCLSAFWSSEITSTSKFAQALEESLNSMQTLLSKKN